jgi:hypothetical protein
MRASLDRRALRSAAALALAAVLPVAAAAAGVAPPAPGLIKAEDVDPETFRSENLWRMSFPEKFEDEPARCKVCGRPLKDHLDPNFVCQDPMKRTVKLDERPAACPVCDNEFTAPVPEKDPSGEVDHDFCRHPEGVHSQTADAWLCPRCGFAAFYWDFNKPLDEDTKRFVREKVTPGTYQVLRRYTGFDPEAYKFEDFSFLDQKSVPDFLKYENAVAIYGRRQSGAAEKDRPGHRTLARIHLAASHAYRREINATFTGLDLSRAIRRVEARLYNPLLEGHDALTQARAARRTLERADAEDASPSEKLSEGERYYLLIRLAGLHDRLGEGWWSRRYLEEARKTAAADEDEKLRAERGLFARQRQSMLEREMHHQARAAKELRSALLAGEVPTRELLVSAYLAGETLYRVGEMAKALPWLEVTERIAKALAERKGSDQARQLLSWARFRLNSPAVFKSGGGGERIGQDPEEKATVSRVLGAPLAALSDAVEAPAPPAEEGPERKAAPPRATGPPRTCHEQMGRIWEAISAHRKLTSEYPPSLEALVEARLISKEAAGNFACVESGRPLFYRHPPPGAGKTFILYHSDPTSCTCRNVLYSDGTISELGR